MEDENNNTIFISRSVSLPFFFNYQFDMNTYHFYSKIYSFLFICLDMNTDTGWRQDSGVLVEGLILICNLIVCWKFLNFAAKIVELSFFSSNRNQDGIFLIADEIRCKYVALMA